jgi:ABC-type Fe3+/spermidine/putrescine transport system ATPase subunit
LSPALLELRAITVRAGARAILQLESLSVAPAETVVILGANGAGKSTLIRIAGGLRTPDHGELILDGEHATPAALRRATTAVLQRPLLRRATVRSNVETGLRFARVAPDERRRRADDWIDRLGLAALADRHAAELSGGEAQRVSLARAFVTAPRLLLLDEPFTNLDAPTRAELLVDLRQQLADTNTAALFVTHDRHEAAAVADRIAILHAGTLRQLGAPADVVDRPADADCARLLGYENILPASIAGRLLPDGVAGPAAVRAADITVVPEGRTASIERLLPLGPRTRIVISLDGHRILSDTSNPPRATLAELRSGSQVDLRVDNAVPLADVPKS